MLFTWVPGYGPHVLWQYVKGWFCFLLLGAIFWFAPEIVHAVVDSKSSPVLDYVTDYHYLLITIAFIGAAALVEIQGRWMWSARMHKYVHPQFQARIARLAQRAGLSHIPAVVALPGRTNAAATASLFFGSKLLVSGDVIERLDDLEEEAVFAHEIAHLKHKDVFAFFLATTGMRAIQLQIDLILILIAWSFFAGTWTDVVQLFLAWLTTAVLVIAYTATFMSFSRCREYLADMGAVAIAGANKRDDLIRAIITVQTGAKCDPFRVLSESRLFQSHPSTGDRARALGVEVWIHGDTPVVTEIV